MSNPLRIILWSVFSLGMLFLAIIAFWVFLLIVGVIIIARFISAKLFNKPSGMTIRTYTKRPGARNMNPPNPGEEPPQGNGQYTTVIDGDDPDKEYKIPKVK